MIFYYFYSSIKVINFILLQIIRYFYLLFDGKKMYFNLVTLTLFQIFIIKNLVLTYGLIIFAFPQIVLKKKMTLYLLLLIILVRQSDIFLLIQSVLVEI